MWHSIHIYIHNYEAIDKFLSNEFYSFLNENEKLFTRYFYIRYWLGGPHVRFRFQEKPGVDILKVKRDLEWIVSNFLQTNNFFTIQEQEFYTKEMVKNENIEAEDLFWARHGSVVFDRYIPEVERYSGQESMFLTEEIFCQSTKLALEINKLPFSKRLYVSGLLFQYAFNEFKNLGANPEDYALLWESYKQYPIHQDSIKKVLTRLPAHKKVPEIFSTYFKTLSNNIVKDEHFLSVLYSHMHMLNNRIGVFPIYEYWLSKLMSEGVGY